MKDRIIIKRDQLNSSLQATDIVSLKVNEKDKKIAIEQIKKATESTVLGWSHIEQKKYLEQSITKISVSSDLLKKALADKSIKSILFDMMLYGKYLFQYIDKNDTKNRDHYLDKFKACLKDVKGKGQDIKLLLEACAAEKEILPIVSFAYLEVLAQEALLEEFRIGELVAHNIAYQVAKSNSQLEKVVIHDQDDEFIESYTIHEIKVMHDGKRDESLMGCVLVPDQHVDQVKTVYITYAGTYSEATARADLQVSAGAESFYRGEDQIIKQVFGLLEKIGGPLKLVCGGHSLGGALAQSIFHSTQRHLALNMPDSAIKQKMQLLESEFQEKLKKFGIVSKDISSYKFDAKQVQKIKLAVWNSTGVLQPVSDYSNALSRLLHEQNIAHHGSFGYVGGDAVQATGQASVLNDVPDNKALVKVLKIEPPTTRAPTTVLANVGSLPVGLVLFGTTPLGWVAASMFVGAVAATTIKTKTDAHTMFHFTKGTNPYDHYELYASHKPDGSIDEAGCKKIQYELGFKSVLTVNGALLISHILDNAESLSEEKLLELFKSGGMDTLINTQDTDGKTALHHAIEKGYFKLATEMLGSKNININQCDNLGNSPFIAFMHKINAGVVSGSSAYDFGITCLKRAELDLSFLNQNKELMEKIHSIYGTIATPNNMMFQSKAKQFMDDLVARMKSMSIASPALAVKKVG